jgi:hypothetical protein
MLETRICVAHWLPVGRDKFYMRRIHTVHNPNRDMGYRFWVSLVGDRQAYYGHHTTFFSSYSIILV